MRNVILHFHLFKNAGTSLDETLKKNFPNDEWVTKEFPANHVKNRQMVKEWIVNNPQAKCFSSHTAFLHIPEIEGVNVIPVIFMRHPIDRIVSAYSFEKKQGGDTFGAVLARNTSLSGYIETRLSIKHERQCRDFHVDRFAVMFDGSRSDELSRAKRAVDELPFVGDVGRFDDSVKKLESILKDHGFLDISLTAEEKNVSRVSKSVLEKLEDLKENVGGEFYDKLISANSNDITLYEYLQGDSRYE